MAAQRLVLSVRSVPRFAPHVRLRHDQVRDRWVVLAPERMFVPDEIGVAVLKLCDPTRDIDAIIDHLAAEYDAPRGEIAADILAMLQDLTDKGVLCA